MSVFWNDRIRNTTPYTAGEQPKSTERLIKINTNENPYPPSEKVFEAISSVRNLQLYPDPNATEAVEAFARVYNLRPQQVFAANGSDEILAFCFLAFWDETRPVNFPDISYSFYPVYSEFFKVRYNRIPMMDKLYVDVDALCAAPGGIIIANPNAPTSVNLQVSDIRRILEAHPNDVVVVDEAYADFADENAMSLLSEYKNLIVTRTMSKAYSLAGVRVGFAAASEELIDGINRAKNSVNSYTMDSIAIKAAAAALLDTHYFNESINRIKTTRDRTASQLRELGFVLPDSAANFLYVTHPDMAAEKIFGALRGKNIIARYFPAPKTAEYLRISIGTEEEMEIVVSALREILNR